jgi:hypothetical protein
VELKKEELEKEEVSLGILQTHNHLTKGIHQIAKLT